jgi:hypothetical protein
MQLKTMTRSILLAWAAFAACAIYGGQPALGLAGVDVVVKQNPTVRAVTDARGSFTLAAVPPGSYALIFRARKAKDNKSPGNKVTIADSYSIKVDGTKRAVNQSGLTTEKLLAGINIPVEVGTGAKVRGQVTAGGLQKMVWIPKEAGSNIPGNWAEADSAEAKAATRNTTVTHSREDMREIMNRGNANMTDPGGAFDPARSTQIQESPR